MVLGFGFNKAKVLSAAEKYVQQGKLQNAVNEYEKVLKHEPKDLTVLNTVGDLYARLGQNENAVNYFRKVGDTYAADGFTPKAIAMYKKLTKLSPSAIDCFTRLAELYTQQGLYNDARTQYLVVADFHLKNRDNEAAAAIFQKVLTLDPENTAMQTRLADLYIKMGKRTEARDIFFRAAQALHGKMAMDAANEALGKVLALDPGNVGALLMRGQLAVETGNGAVAVQALESIADLDSRPDALRALLRGYLLLTQFDQAEPIATKLLTVHNDVSGISYLAEGMLNAGNFEQALRLYEAHADRLLASSAPALISSLQASISRIKENAAALSLARSLMQKAGETTGLTEVTELLAHACVQSGDLSRARDLYRELAGVEPENPVHMQNYKQMVAKMGDDSAARPLSTEEGGQALMVEALEQSAPAIEQEYPPELQQEIQAAITDSELFSSYNVPGKAIEPLETVLPKAPRDLQLNQRLAALYVRAERFAEAAACCEVMAELYSVAGLQTDSEQYAATARKYRESAGAAVAEPEAAAEPESSVAEFSMEVVPPAVEAETLPTPEFSMEVATPPAETPAGEVDLSNEWDEMVDVEAPPAEAQPTSEAPAESKVAAFFFESAAAPAAEPASQPAAEPAPMAAAAAASASSDLLGDLVSDLEEALPDFAPPPAPAAKAAPVASAPAAEPAPMAAAAAPAQETDSALSDIFAEFKEDIEGTEAEVEDPDTHYNLGVAFREMGLLDEAIGELQKVCQAVEAGRPFDQSLQAYTWLAQCLVEKGAPQAGIRWYEKALRLPGLAGESRLSVYYDMANAHELGGNRKAALDNFMEVYGQNIDFRDVAERIKALKS